MVQYVSRTPEYGAASDCVCPTVETVHLFRFQLQIADLDTSSIIRLTLAENLTDCIKQL